ncbi:hypothetical protein B0H19DRAFT_1065247 [Mycena capillaripes]|nr:hypothetical protein B0H19DRAFT_1065247 [Mycena capillaripes]
MPTKPIDSEIQLSNITAYLTITAQTLGILAHSVKAPFLEAISNTTQSLLNNIQLLERAQHLLEAIILVHLGSDTGRELPPSILNQVGRFTQTLYKIHTFVEAQQGGNKVKIFFRQSEMSSLLKDCKAGLQQGFESFQAS